MKEDFLNKEYEVTLNFSLALLAVKSNKKIVSEIHKAALNASNNQVLSGQTQFVWTKHII